MLTFTKDAKPANNVDPVLDRREKFATTIKQQIELSKNPGYTIKRGQKDRKVRALPTWTVSDGTQRITLKYANQELNLEGKGATLHIPKGKFEATLVELIKAVEAGDFDKALTAAVEARAASKGKKTPKKTNPKKD